MALLASGSKWHDGYLQAMGVGPPVLRASSPIVHATECNIGIPSLTCCGVASVAGL